MQKQISIVSAIFILLSSCKNEDSKLDLAVSGVLSNSKAKTIYLEELLINPTADRNRLAVDSFAVEKDGSYKLKASGSESAVYVLRLDKNQFPFASIVNDVKEIKLNAVFNAENNAFAEKYEVTGSVASQQLKDFMANMSNGLQKISVISQRGDSLYKAKAPDSIMQPLVDEHRQITLQLKNIFLDGLAQSKNAAQSMFELGYYQSSSSDPAFGLEPLSNEEVTKIFNGLAAKYPKHKAIGILKNQMDQMMTESNKKTNSSWIGQQAPEISLPDANGKLVKLSDYKGKYVLVDFWASWCRPCRAENPNVVAAFNQYKEKNIDFLGVSLDEEKESWLKAIQKDKLSWTHVSDLKGWESAVVPIYGFGEVGIPYNVLVDPQGKIIAERLRGDELSNKLAEVLR